MAKKQDSYYFQNFIECADCSCRAAHLLKDVMEQFDQDSLPARLEEIHQIEHEADMKKHELLNVLTKAFITPLEREDIMLLSQNLDDMTDTIEDVLLKIYCNRVSAMEDRALELTDVVIRCCEEVRSLMLEFPSFKKSRQFQEHIIRINSIEEEADRLFIDCMYDLHDGERSPLEVIAWREIYLYLEKCADACEHVADAVERAVMKNS